LIHDPDADRLGVLIPSGGTWRALSGNEIGLLLADHVLTHGAGRDRLVVDTVVSSSALAELAAFHDVHHVRTLTGFKWIVRPAIEHPDWRFVFGYEEALGYSVDPYVRDKDGISAALYFAHLMASLKARDSSVELQLRELAMRHGMFATRSFAVVGDDERAASVAMSQLRRGLPATIDDRRVVQVEDLLHGNGMPATDLLVLRLEREARVCLRPSGTEPKLKVYLEVIRHPSDAAACGVESRRAAGELEALRIALRPMLEAMMNG
jgi:phosphomannomutase